MQTNDILTNQSDEIQELLVALDEVTANIKLELNTHSSSQGDERYLDNHQVCDMLHISQRTLQDYRDKKRVSFYKLEGKILYKLSDIEQMLEANYYKTWE
ncbi:helix-turn-helix domain-containing protein [Bacteroides coprosuis]|uniref:helix-turn-helix domain-containing protein n=1 Tax=Bacteroides coprosuis TaxID=151276 RepID=UPI001DB771E5|nr:helix-turn-helix domain-containing protein [Bacteroides coprosuis]HJD93131.1 helix-turn-helix domain-containing protein [Bacteroides coprosuis]